MEGFDEQEIHGRSVTHRFGMYTDSGARRGDMIYINDGSMADYLEFQVEPNTFTGHPPVFMSFRNADYRAGGEVEVPTVDGIPSDIHRFLKMLQEGQADGRSVDEMLDEYETEARISLSADDRLDEHDEREKRRIEVSDPSRREIPYDTVGLCFYRNLSLGDNLQNFAADVERMQEGLYPTALAWSGQLGSVYVTGYGAEGFLRWLYGLNEEDRAIFSIGAESGETLISIKGRHKRGLLVDHNHAVSLCPDEQDLKGIFRRDAIGRARLRQSDFFVPLKDAIGMDTPAMSYFGGVFKEGDLQETEPLVSFMGIASNAFRDLPVPKFFKNDERVIPIIGVSCATHYINHGALLQIREVERYDNIYWVKGLDKPENQVVP